MSKQARRVEGKFLGGHLESRKLWTIHLLWSGKEYLGGRMEG